MAQPEIQTYFSDKPKVHVSVDCIVFGFDEGALKLLLMKKKEGFMEGHWSLIGSMVAPEENLRDATFRVLKDSTGLDTVYLDQLKTFGKIDRVPGDRIISVAFYALIRLGEHDKEVVKDYGASWFNIHEKPDLIYDHDEMVVKALDDLRSKARHHELGFELLPKKFTIPQLQHFFEEIYQEEFDKRNFRKKILSLGILKKLDEKDRVNSKKGAFLYCFDKEKYDKLELTKSFF